MRRNEDGFSFGAVGVKQPILLLFAPTWDYSGGPLRYTSLYSGDDDDCDEDGYFEFHCFY